MTSRRALLLLGPLFGCVRAMPASAGAEINIGFSPSADVLPVFVAKDKGFFQKRGLDVTPTRIPLISNIPASLMAGSLQIGLTTGPILLQTAEGGLDLVAVSGAARFLKNNPTVSLVARPGLKVANAAALRGKKVGVPGLNATLHVLFMRWLLDNKVPLDQVTMVEASFVQMKDLLRSGTLDAVVVIEPFRGSILSDGSGVRVADYIGEVQPNILAAFYIARRDWVDQHAQAMKAFRDALDEAIAYCQQHPDEARASQLKYLGASSSVMPSFTTEIRTADLELWVKVTRDLAMLQQPVDVAKLIAK